MKKLLQRSIIQNFTKALLVFFVLFFIVARPTHAAPMFTENLGQWWAGLSGQQYNKQVFDFQSFIGMFSGLITMVFGCADPCPASLRSGAIDKTAVAIAGVYANPPASGIYYAQDLLQNFGPVKPAYAQTGTTGFTLLQPFLKIWRAVRNLTYIIFVIGIIGMGLAIMFRTKISPQATITIQSALPRLVIALLLVTFSYAIVGLLIDLTYVIFGVLTWGLHTGGLYSQSDAAAYFREYSSAGFANVTGFIFDKGLGGAWDVIQGTAPYSNIIGGSLIGIAAAVIGLIARVPTAVGGTVGISSLASVSVTLLPLILGLGLAILFFFIRILFELAKAYLLLLFYLIFGPILILWSVVTGSGVWEGWLKGLLANLLVFPAVGIIIFLVSVLLTTIQGPVWGPPYVGGGIDIIRGMIALGAIMLLPTIPSVISQFLGAKPLPIQLPQAQQQIQQMLNSLSSLGGRLIK